MSKRCELTGISPLKGHNVSHAKNKTKRRFLPNLQKKRIWVKELNKFVTVKLTARALKTVAKNGTSEIAKLVRENKI